MDEDTALKAAALKSVGGSIPSASASINEYAVPLLKSKPYSFEVPGQLL